MAFNLQNWDKLSNAGNPNVREQYSYASSTDSIATISGSAYFNDIAEVLAIGDQILLNGSDGVDTVNVSAVSPNVTVAADPDVPPGSITSASMAASLLKYTTATMSAAEFNGAYASPHLILAAQGGNTLIVPEQVRLVMTYGTVAFANGGVAHLQWGNTANGAGVIATTTQAAASFQATASTTFTLNAGVVLAPFATTVNQGLYFSNITGAFDTGDSDFVVHLWYRTIATV